MATNLVELFVLSTRDMVIYHMVHLFCFILIFFFVFIALYSLGAM